MGGVDRAMEAVGSVSLVVSGSIADKQHHNGHVSRENAPHQADRPEAHLSFLSWSHVCQATVLCRSQADRTDPPSLIST